MSWFKEERKPVNRETDTKRIHILTANEARNRVLSHKREVEEYENSRHTLEFILQVIDYSSEKEHVLSIEYQKVLQPLVINQLQQYGYFVELRDSYEGNPLIPITFISWE